jgi:adenine-specific DNA-methyltransferase
MQNTLLITGKLLIHKQTIDDLIEIFEKKESSKFQYLEPVFNRDYFKDKTFVFSNDNDTNILNTILEKGKFFIDGKKELMSGIDVLQDSVNKNSQLLLGDNFKVGDGIFVISDNEKENLNLSDKELELIKPYYTSKELSKYFGESKNSQWIIYTNSSFKDPRRITPYPNIKKHFDKFRAVITSENGPYGLNRPREEYFFQGTKIMSSRNVQYRHLLILILIVTFQEHFFL